jgi:adenosylcobinamide kinase/adenosylcobinamide-phosphate guanylyltransferase
MNVVLVLGGTRSGKSCIAQGLAEAQPGPLTFVATAEVFDAEMADRVSRHKAYRGSRWSLAEVPLALPQFLASEEARSSTILVDCLTVWLGNLMHHEQDVRAGMDALVAALRSSRSAPIYLVSNEVGQGIVPDNVMARAFRDDAGRLNQRLASVADEVLFVTAGIPQVLKRASP